MKKILVLGGTKFIGRNLVNRLIELDKYEITLFNRQQSGADLFPIIRKIKGDRTTNSIQQIADEQWDFVIDLSCYHPNYLIKTLENIKPNTERYIFISTCSVYDYKAYNGEMRDENAPILSCSEEAYENQDMYKFYGNKKAECERILANSNLNHRILRPALVYGRFDYTDRFYYWLYQVKTKETLLLPDNGSRFFSITYVDDLVNAIIESLTNNTTETVFNVVSIPQLSIRQIVDIAQSLLEKERTLLNAPPQFLHDNSINQWTTIPLWIGNDNYTYNNQRLRQEFSFQLKDFSQATAETIDYYDGLDWFVPKYGMSETERIELMEKLL